MRVLTLCNTCYSKPLNKLLATRITSYEKIAFKQLAEHYKLTESALLRIIVSSVINDKEGEILRSILNKLSDDNSR